ncbi:MAG: Ig-like domain-containing protein, partial [Eubacterium sp.]
NGVRRFKTTVWPSRLGQSVAWKSSNPSIASITNKGTIRVKKSGMVKFTVKKAGKKILLKVNTEDL